MAKVIDDYTKVAESMFAKNDVSDEVADVVADMAKMLQFEIHQFLVPLHIPEAEKKIREYVKLCNSTLLPLIDRKIDRKRREIDTIGNVKFGLAVIPEDMKQLMIRYMEIRDDVYALICCRSLKHFALFMEEDKIPEEQDWHNAGSLFDGLWYHANRMILDGTVNLIEKQMFTGAGKSYSDIVMMAFILGIDIENDVIKMFGNKVNIAPTMNSIVAYMTSRRYARVFPYYQQFSCSEEMMFETKKKTSGQLKIKGSSRPMNISINSKDTSINGIRCKFLFLDDITQEVDAGNMRMHQKDIDQFEGSWKKRWYYHDKFSIIAGGTSYSIYDFLSYLRNTFGAGKQENITTHKYTEVAKCNQMVENGEAVFVKIPKLDYETDESTFPTKYPTNQAKIERLKNPKLFEAMDQQNPQPPEGTPFAEEKLTHYDEIPHTGEVDCCWACIDPARTGKNYVTMLILERHFVDGKIRHFFKDCLYEMRPMIDMYKFFVEKIIQHKITKLHIERNTDTSLKALLDKMLQDAGVSFCTITEIYSVKKKEDKIYDMEAAIINNIVFPRTGMYYIGSQMGTAMKHIMAYSYMSKNDFDDAPDCLAMFCEKFVVEARKLPQVQVLDMRRRKYGQ